MRKKWRRKKRRRSRSRRRMEDLNAVIEKLLDIHERGHLKAKKNISAAEEKQ